jgi:hypothetical protein
MFLKSNRFIYGGVFIGVTGLCAFSWSTRQKMVNPSSRRTISTFEREQALKVFKTNPLELTEELKHRAFSEFNEIPEKRAAFLQVLRSAINSSPISKDAMDTSDRNLVRFARAQKYNSNLALQQCMDYRHFLMTYGSDLQNISREEIVRFQDGYSVIKEPGPTGRLIVIIHAKKVLTQFSLEYKLANPKYFLRYNYFLLELLCHNPYAQLCGTILIFDCQGLTWREKWTFTHLASLFDMIAVMKLFQIGGIQLDAALTYKETMFISYLWFVIRPFLDEKLTPKFHFCGNNLQSIHERVSDISVLPESLGGSIPDEDEIFTQWTAMLDEVH